MAIKVGDTLPLDARLKEMSDAGPKDVAASEIFKGKKVVLFAVPGAFTPTCSMKHLPGFVSDAEKIRAKGVDDIVCVSGNDHADGDLAVVGGVGGVEGAAAVIEPDLAPNLASQLVGKGVGLAGCRRHALRSPLWPSARSRNGCIFMTWNSSMAKSR